MLKQLVKYAVAVLFAGMAFLEIHAAAPSRNMAGAFLAAATDAVTAGEAALPCPDTFVDPETEGPYYKTGSPQRRDLIEEGVTGEVITLSGYVFDKEFRCQQ